MITVTDTAAVKVKTLIDAEGEDGLALRVAVRPGGCSGFSYEMFFDSEVAADDVTVEHAGVKVVVDPSSACCDEDRSGSKSPSSGGERRTCSPARTERAQRASEVRQR